MTTTINKLIAEATEILEGCELKWRDEFLNPKDFSPNWDFGQEDEQRWFNVIIGKIIAMLDVREEVKEIISLINNNTIGAWEHDLEATTDAVTLEDHEAEENRTIEYNGWFEKLNNLTK